MSTSGTRGRATSFASFAPRTVGKSHVLTTVSIKAGSVRVIIIEVRPSLPTFDVVSHRGRAIQLKGFSRGAGRLAARTVSQTITTLGHYYTVTTDLGTRRVITITADTIQRTTGNRSFIRQICRRINLTIGLVSNARRTHQVCLKILSNVRFRNRPRTIVSVNNKSARLVLKAKRPRHCLDDAGIKTIHLATRFVGAGPIDRVRFTTLQTCIQKVLRLPVRRLHRGLLPKRSVHLVNASKAVRYLTALTTRHYLGLIPSPLGNCRVDCRRLSRLIRSLHQTACTRQLTVPRVSSQQTRVVITKTIVLRRTVKLLGIGDVAVYRQTLQRKIIIS